eukprot:CAMPEP_0169334030 /NCGR_PEP_ID=MMETSP1017-20121227/15576_1 /TAXON_ID=342587 /ORGANISM="Karlodinium micrum, Strain CCMP2283" /LENGTH=43 /DNA_ID= /DNA_START= /DNA_END= /DNA_ORIENTATION=
MYAPVHNPNDDLVKVKSPASAKFSVGSFSDSTIVHQLSLTNLA